MMPPRFWVSGRSQTRDGLDPLRAWPMWRPPRSSTWVMYQHSLRLWAWVQRALLVTGLGSLLLIVAAALTTGGPITIKAWVVAGGLVLGIVLLAGLWWLHLKPEIGSHD